MTNPDYSSENSFAPAAPGIATRIERVRARVKSDQTFGYQLSTHRCEDLVAILDSHAKLLAALHIEYERGSRHVDDCGCEVCRNTRDVIAEAEVL